MLPPLFEMEDYESCIRTQSQYCKVQAKLEVPSSNSGLLQHINELISDNTKMDRSFVHRAICLSTIDEPNSQQVEIQLSKLLNKKLESYNLTAKVDSYQCTNGKTPISLFDNFFMFLVMAYMVLILFATYYTFIKRKSSTGIGEFLTHFSLSESWKRRISIKNPDYKNLISMQGFRVFLMTFEIYTHVMTYYLTVYIENPESFEKQMDMKVMEPLRYVAPSIILTFFVISSWLSTLQAYNIYEKYGQLSLKHVGIMIINRYFRFIIVLLIALAWKTNWIRILEGPLNFDLIDINQNACKTKWLNKVLYINNFNVFADICSPYTWSLNSDFQMYVINTLILFVMFKYKLNEYKTYGMLLVFCCFLQSIILYNRGFNIHQMSVRNIEIRHIQHSNDGIVVFFSTITNSSSSCIGIILGAIYFKNKRREIKHKQLISILWAALFISLPAITALMSMKEYGRLGDAIMGSISKPIVCLGMGVGILGMSHNMGGIVKNIFENKYLMLLGNFSFSIYLCHEFVLLQKHKNGLPVIEDNTVMRDFMMVFPTCLVFGVLITLIVEEPLRSLQKTIVPQIDVYDKKMINKTK